MAFFVQRYYFKEGGTFEQHSFSMFSPLSAFIKKGVILRARANEAGLLVSKLLREGWNVPTFTVLQSRFIVVIKD